MNPETNASPAGGLENPCISSLGVPVQDTTGTRQREDGLPAEIVDAVALVAPWGFPPARREDLAAEVLNAALADPIVAAGLLEHLLETAGYTRNGYDEQLMQQFEGSRPVPFTSLSLGISNGRASQMPHVWTRRRVRLLGPWSPDPDYSPEVPR